MDVASLQVIIKTQGVEAAQKELDKLTKSSGNAEKSVGGLASSMKTLSAIASVGAMATLAKEAVKMADSMKLVDARLSLVTKGTQELSIAQNELFKISQNTRQSFKDTSDLYISLSCSTQSLGKSARLTAILNRIVSHGQHIQYLEQQPIPTRCRPAATCHEAQCTVVFPGEVSLE